ncbi:MAG: cytochrome c [Rhodospirillaceae bacterium]
MKTFTGLVIGAFTLIAVAAVPPAPAAAQAVNEKLMMEIKQKVSDEKAAVAIHDRRLAMRAMGAEMKKVADYMKDGTGSPSDVAAAGTRVAAIARTLPELFPSDTGLDKYPGATGAKPLAWEKPDDLKKYAMDLQAHAEKLAEVASASGADKASIGAAFGTVGKGGCGGCHTAMREKLN